MQITAPNFLIYLIFVVLMVGPAVIGIGGLSAYIFFVLSVPFFVGFTLKTRSPGLKLDLIGAVFVGIFATQVGLSFISAQSPSDFAFGLNFLPLLFYVPIRNILVHSKHSSPVELFAKLSLISSFLALLAATIYVYGLQYSRGGAPNINPLGLASVALNSGFFALMGVKSALNKTKFLYFLGPIAALGTIMLTQSRGHFLTFIVMMLITFPLIWRGRQGAVMAVASVAIVGFGSLLAGLIFGFGRWEFLQSLPAALAGGEVDLGSSVQTRLALYAGAIEAFKVAPWFGHGWGHMMDAVLPLIPDGFEGHNGGSLGHLHNDFLDFAVTGGVIGIATYVACLGVPLFAAISSERDKYYESRLLGVVLLVASYFFRGLTDLMIGFEANTLYYVAILAIFFGLFRETKTSQN